MSIRDLPDNYPWMPGSTRYPMPDMGELAVRLGSPIIYDRRGEVIFADRFDNGMGPYITQALGTGASVKVTASDTDIGPFAAELIGGSDGGQAANVLLYFSPTSLQSVGFEVSTYYTSTAFDSVILDLARYDGTNIHWGRVRIGPGDEQFYFNSAGGWTSFATEKVWASSNPIYHNLKLVVDMDDDEYVRFLYDEVEYDLSNIAIRVQASASEPQHVVQFALASASGQNDKVQLGRFIVTANEP